MNLRHPFECLSSGLQVKLFVVFSSLAVLLLISLQLLGRPLVTQQAPLGIVSFELAGDFSTSVSILSSWDNTAKIYAGLNLGLDYLFIALYPIAIGLGCVLISEKLSRRLKLFSLVGVILAWTQLAAGAMDVVENYSLIELLMGSQEKIWSPVAFYCATVKFSFVILGLLYVSVGLLSTLFERQNASSALHGGE